MADKQVNNISLKALVDKGNNKVIFAELNEGLIDVLFSFLTMPMGTIIKLTRNQPPSVDVGCMNNLYKSVENFDVQRLRTEACKTMLLCPRSGAETHCRRLKLKIDGGEPTRYFLCSSLECTNSKFKLLSHHSGALCGCGEPMSREINLSNIISKKMISAIQDGGVFVKGLTRFLISDDFQVMPPSTTASFSLLSKLGVMDEIDTIEERTFDVGVVEVLDLLKCSFVSKTPLTETLLKHKPAVVPQLSKKDVNRGTSIQYNLDGKICVKIMVSKSRKVVCYAEAGEDFVDLLFSFLTLPLGYIVKEMQGTSSEGCVDHLYSVKDLDVVHYMKSEEHKAMLVNPKVAPGFRYENQPLDIEEASHPPYYYGSDHDQYNPCYYNVSYKLTTYETKDLHQGRTPTVLTVMDPKSHYKETRKDGGFVEGPAMFTVTDNLVITPMSPFSAIPILKELKISPNDIAEHVVSVGNEEALRLLVASFVSESALTNAFIRGEPKQE